jgi:hypothetical protein
VPYVIGTKCCGLDRRKYCVNGRKGAEAGKDLKNVRRTHHRQDQTQSGQPDFQIAAIQIIKFGDLTFELS